MYFKIETFELSALLEFLKKWSSKAVRFSYLFKCFWLNRYDIHRVPEKTVRIRMGSKETNVWPEAFLLLSLIFLITVKPFINLRKGGNVTLFVLPFS